MDTRKGHDTEVITSGLAEVNRGVAAWGEAMMPALISRKLRQLNIEHPSLCSRWNYTIRPRLAPLSEI